MKIVSISYSILFRCGFKVICSKIDLLRFYGMAEKCIFWIHLAFYSVRVVPTLIVVNSGSLWLCINKSGC